MVRRESQIFHKPQLNRENDLRGHSGRSRDKHTKTIDWKVKKWMLPTEGDPWTSSEGTHRDPGDLLRMYHHLAAGFFLYILR